MRRETSRSKQEQKSSQPVRSPWIAFARQLWPILGMISEGIGSTLVLSPISRKTIDTANIILGLSLSLSSQSSLQPAADFGPGADDLFLVGQRLLEDAAFQECFQIARHVQGLEDAVGPPF